jgi:hypothetical protein
MADAVEFRTTNVLPRAPFDLFKRALRKLPVRPTFDSTVRLPASNSSVPTSFSQSSISGFGVAISAHRPDRQAGTPARHRAPESIV